MFNILSNSVTLEVRTTTEKPSQPINISYLQNKTANKCSTCPHAKSKKCLFDKNLI